MRAVGCHDVDGYRPEVAVHVMAERRSLGGHLPPLHERRREVRYPNRKCKAMLTFSDGPCKSNAMSTGYCRHHARLKNLVHRPIMWTQPVNGPTSACTCLAPLVASDNRELVEAVFAEHLDDLERNEQAAQALEAERKSRLASAA